jgi:hypothetical protein
MRMESSKRWDVIMKKKVFLVRLGFQVHYVRYIDEEQK